MNKGRVEKTKKELKKIFDECKSGDCKKCFSFVNKFDIVFDGESIVQHQRAGYCGHEKICDCIILCKNGKILIVEYLEGKLTLREKDDKLKQLECCERIVKILLTGCLVYKILIYQKLDIPSAKRHLINKWKGGLMLIQERNIKKDLCVKIDS